MLLGTYQLFFSVIVWHFFIYFETFFVIPADNLLISFYSLGSTSDSLTNTEDNNNQSRTAFNFANDTDANIDGEDNNDGLKTFQKLFKNNNFHQLLGNYQ